MPNETELLKKRVEDLERQVKTLVEVLIFVKDSSATRLNIKNEVAFVQGSAVGFFGKDPVKQQTLASDTLANLLTALRTLGLIT